MFEFVAILGEEVLRVEVKTSTRFTGRSWHVMLETRGGNQSWTGL